MDGPDLRKHITTHGPLPSVLVASLGATLAEALAAVHKQGLLHRDLKPANILLGPNGPKIIDFGLAVFTESSASLTAPNTVMGTPACMSPEQANGVKPLTSRRWTCTRSARCCCTRRPATTRTRPTTSTCCST